MTSVANPRLTQPLKWHGGKHYLAERIIELMPPHLHYVEPYFGGGALLLNKSPHGVSEVVNDIHHQLTNFWRVLQDESLFATFKRIVDAVPFSQVEWTEADEHDEDQTGEWIWGDVGGDCYASGTSTSSGRLRGCGRCPRQDLPRQQRSLAHSTHDASSGKAQSRN